MSYVSCPLWLNILTRATQIEAVYLGSQVKSPYITVGSQSSWSLKQQLTSHSQPGDRKECVLVLNWLSPFHSVLYQSPLNGTIQNGWVFPPHPNQNNPYKHATRPIFQEILDSAKLMIGINQHTWQTGGPKFILNKLKNPGLSMCPYNSQCWGS